MQQDLKTLQNKEVKLTSFLIFKFLPYWPLFVLLFVFCTIIGWFALRYITPQYEATTTVLINDEKKGSDDSRMMESLNIFTSKKILKMKLR